MEGLKGKVVVVTGGASGIGAAIATRFGKEGSKVVVADMGDGSDVVKSIESAGGTAICLKADVTDYENVKQMISEVMNCFGRIDVMINNAGINSDNLIKKMTPEQFSKVIAVNLTGVFNCTSVVVPYMLEQKTGVVLTTSSVVGLYGNVGVTNYAASKWGVIGMTKCWAKENAKYGLRFNCVAPGFIATDMVKKIPENILQERILSKVPAGRLGEPEEIAAAFAFLASDEAKFINGAVLSVDGACTL